MKKSTLVYFAALLLLFSQQLAAQNGTPLKKWKVAVFTPLYLDSAFDASFNYTYIDAFPKFLNPGLEFMEGIEKAADSLSKLDIQMDIHVFDTRSSRSSVPAILAQPVFKSFDMIIGHVNANESRLLAEAAAKNQKPFINVNYPNDAGIHNNPYYVILNSTLEAQFSALYKFLQRNYGTSEIVYVKRKSANDDRLLDAIKAVEKNTSSVPLKMKYVTLEGFNYDAQLSKFLDSNRNNVLLAGSLDVNFAQSLLQGLKNFGESYRISLFGMPTWDNLDVAKHGADNISVFYGTPFYLNFENPAVEAIQEDFKETYYSRPTDMYFRGFETLLNFGRLLQEHGSNIASGLTDKKFRVFTEFDIQPVLDPKTMTLDYFENKKIYFVEKAGREVKGVF
jgi:hypothetical protein